VSGSSDVLGIDLGTTFCAMAMVDSSGRARILPNADGHHTTPTALYFYEANGCILGREAVRMSVEDPATTVRFFKRYLGDPEYRVRFYGHDYSPQELNALVLRCLVADASEALGRPLKRVVLTVPASFNSAQRNAVVESAGLAGLEVLTLLNEPTAAAIAHLADTGEMVPGTTGDRTSLIFDLGGGTLDATVMVTEPTAHRILATTGQSELGGKEWDERLVAHVAEICEDRTGVDPRDEPRAYHDLYERCVAAKIRLSVESTARVALRVGSKPVEVELDRALFEALSQDLLERCATTAKEALKLADVAPESLDEVLLVGGSTHMPMVQGLLRSLFGDIITFPAAPETLVARGAALAGALSLPATSADPSAAPKRRIQDITSHDLGLVVLDADLAEQILTLIPAATPVPHATRGRFATAFDGMTAVQVEITEGSPEDRDVICVIGTLVLSDLPPRPRGTPIDVIYRYNTSQILEVDVVDVETGHCRAIQVKLAGSLEDRERSAARRIVQKTRVN
jgi:molecular chaperone DnaK